MRKLFAVSSLLFGLAVAALAAPLALWAAAAAFRPAWARDWALWGIEHSPLALPLYAPPAQVAHDAVQRDSLVVAGLVAAVLIAMALSALRSSRHALRAADQSHDGKATLELKHEPLRVGQPVEGNIWLAGAPQRGEPYRVELSCQRGNGSARSERDETAYWEELEVAPVRTPVGWTLPFRFAVPPIAPPSGVDRFVSGPGYRWRLSVQRAKGWMSLPSVFALNLAPAPPEELSALEPEEAGRREPRLRRSSYGSVRGTGRDPLFEERPPLREPPPVAPSPDRAEEASPRQPDVIPVFSAGREPPLHERPEFRVDGLPFNGTPHREQRRGPLGTFVKWTFVVLFGGVFAVAAVALATAALLRLLM